MAVRLITFGIAFLAAQLLVNGQGLRRTRAKTEAHHDLTSDALQFHRVTTETEIVGQCSTDQPCGLCQGDCDDDNECSGTLKCFHRDSGGPLPPGCTGSDGSRTDYCYEGPDPTVAPTPATPAPVPPTSVPSPSPVPPTPAPVQLTPQPITTVAPIGPTPSPFLPTASPIHVPTVAPTSPTPGTVGGQGPTPTGLTILAMDTDILCAGADGVDCGDLPSVDFQCSKDSPVSSLSLEYLGGSCSQSYHTQGPHASGDDFFSGSEQTARLVCQGSAAATTLLDQTVSVGGVIALEGDTDLPSDVTCKVSDSGGMTLQQVSFDTSGYADLFVMDRFCSLEVVGCGSSSCFKNDITYTFVLKNTGQTTIKIAAIDRTIGADTRSLLALAFLKRMSDVLLPGDVISISETIQNINVCETATMELKVDMESTTDDRVMSVTESHEFAL